MDIYATLAASVLGKQADQVTPEERATAKSAFWEAFGAVAQLPGNEHLVPEGPGTGIVRSWQREAWANKLRQGFTTDNVPQECMLLVRELCEVFTAWREDELVGEELADVGIFLLGLSEMLGCDLEAEIEAKLAKNAARTYRSLPNGTRVKAE